MPLGQVNYKGAMARDRRQKLTISILTYNRKDILKHLLDSLQPIEYRPLEIIVVDNNSKDGTDEMVRNLYSRILYLRTAQNLGATARNLGLQMATGDVVLTIDDDVIGVDDRSITRLFDYFDRNPRLAAVNFKVLDHVNKGICNWVHHYPVEIYGEREFLTYEITEGAAAFRRLVFARVGYYPEGFFLSHEGPDLGLRLTDAGFDVIYSPDISVVHHHAELGRKRWYNYYFDTRNQLWLAARNLPLTLALRYLSRGLLSMLFYSIRDGFFLYWLKAIFDGLRGLKQALKQRKAIGDRAICIFKSMEKSRPELSYYVRTRLLKRNVRL
jgi:GT2 family glycosyltransferase